MNWDALSRVLEEGVSKHPRVRTLSRDDLFLGHLKLDQR
jgi:hypothetical protein